MHKYIYSISNNTLYGKLNSFKLQYCISTISSFPEIICVNTTDDVIEILFATELSQVDKETLDSVIAEHDGKETLLTCRIFNEKLINVSGKTINIGESHIPHQGEYILTTENKEKVLQSGVVCLFLSNGVLVFKDYKRLRLEFYLYMVNVGGYNSLNDEEKAIAVCNFLVDQQLRSGMLSIIEQIEYGKMFHKFSVESRKRRANIALVLVYNRLQQESIYQLLNDNPIDVLIRKYIDMGVEGTTEGDHEGLFDFIMATNGTSFELTGLAAQAYVPVDQTLLSDLIDDIMAVLKHGIYIP